ncbi:unnamed protein product [Ectocarpus sp. 12 AP-2014]
MATPLNPSQLREQFGPMTLTMVLRAEHGRMHVDVIGGAILGVPVPRFALPRSTSVERAQDGRIVFDISAAMPVLGLMIRYEGWLQPVV